MIMNLLGHPKSVLAVMSVIMTLLIKAFNSAKSCCALKYSIVKDSNAYLRVIFRFLQNSPITKAVCTKISKKIFLHFWQNFDISERK